MGELEATGGQMTAGPVRAIGRWGILGLLPRWLGEQVAAAGVRVETWPHGLTLYPPPTRDVGNVVSPTAAPRTAAVALRRALDDWRAAERELGALEMGSPDRAHLQAEVDTLRATHHRLFLEVSLPSR